MNQSDILALTIDVAKEAGALLRAGQDAVKQLVQKSSAVDLVTEYDESAEKLILSRLRPHFPTHRIQAEESGTSSDESPYTWYIDPLDGTTNFSHGFPTYAVSIALYERDSPLVGVIYDPSRDECFTAARGEGAFLQRANDAPTPLHVSRTETLIQSLVGTGFPYDRHTREDNNWQQFGAFLRKTQGMRRAGAAALDMAYIAAGRLDGYWEYQVKSWDIGAGVLLVQEAGGQITYIDNSPFTIAPSMAIVASNGLIHDEMIATLKPYVEKTPKTDIPTPTAEAIG